VLQAFQSSTFDCAIATRRTPNTEDYIPHTTPTLPGTVGDLNRQAVATRFRQWASQRWEGYVGHCTPLWVAVVGQVERWQGPAVLLTPESLHVFDGSSLRHLLALPLAGSGKCFNFYLCSWGERLHSMVGGVHVWPEVKLCSTAPCHVPNQIGPMKSRPRGFQPACHLQESEYFPLGWSLCFMCCNMA